MKIKIKVTHILGVIVAVTAFFFIHAEASYLVSYLKIVKGEAFHTEAYYILNAGNIISVLVFIAIIICFSKYVKNGLGSYLILSVLVSIAVVCLLVFLTGKVLMMGNVPEKIQNMMAQPEKVLLFSIFVILYMMALIGIFVISFQLMVKRKIKYLEYITAEVKKMEEHGFGKKLAVKSDDELSELSQSISRMSVTLKEKIEEQNRQNEERLQLIADISHDLRTPLTSVIGYGELIQEHIFTEPVKCNEYIEVVNRRLADINTMVDQLFEYTKLNQADYQILKKSVDLSGLFYFIDSEYSRIYRNNQLSWKLDTGENRITANIDSEKFMRAMENLLNNAKKYAVKGSEVIMSVKEQDEQVFIFLSNEIEDPESLDEKKLFDRFYKSDEARSETSGTGLGLPIVRKIIELHGGQITARKDGKRIEFSITIPK